MKGEGEGAGVAGVTGAGGEACGEAFEVLDTGEGGAEGGEAVVFGDEGLDGIEAGVDGGEGAEGANDPVMEEAGTHGGTGSIEGSEEGRAGGIRGCDEVEVMEGGFIEQHGIGWGAEMEGVDMADGAVEVLVDVMEEGAGGGDGGVVVSGAEAIEGLDGEVAAEEIGGGMGVEGPVIAGGEGGGGGGAEGLGKGGGIGEGSWEDNFRGRVTCEVVGEGVKGGGFGHPEVAGGEVEHGEAAEAAREAGDGGEVVCAGGVEDGVVEDGTRGNDGGNFATDEALGEGGVFHLVADSDLGAGLEELGEVEVHGVAGDPAHRGGQTFCEGEAEDIGGADGVIEEHLVEIADTEKEQDIGFQSGLCAAVLVHHGGIGGSFAHVGRE